MLIGGRSPALSAEEQSLGRFRVRGFFDTLKRGEFHLVFFYVSFGYDDSAILPANPGVFLSKYLEKFSAF